jgi:hypothetical protein
MTNSAVFNLYRVEAGILTCICSDNRPRLEALIKSYCGKKGIIPKDIKVIMLKTGEGFAKFFVTPNKMVFFLK